ncbi:MAG: HAMP domain-containing histidine kinase [Actinobacteria bacterium]|nr:MAG: HAMP domain-containing histidine kinase [Actinomycetota bacterium]
MNPLRSVGGRLSLALVVVVAAALALVDLIVVPSLERNLIHTKVNQLRSSAGVVAEEVLPVDPFTIDDTVRTASETSNARVIVFTMLSPRQLIPYSDSSPRSAGLGGDPVALRAATGLAGERVSGTVDRGDQRYAEVATSLGEPYVLLLSASLHDSLANIHQVRRRLLIAGLIALVASLIVGYGAASMFARRLRRLERAAERIAGGDFGEPVSDAGRDEVGELARAFERMRQRLAGLEHARREFIANASHELRTPIFSLGGFLELLENEDLDPQTQREFLATMREQIDRLTKLATDLLDLSRVDAGRIHVEAEAVDLGVLARTLADEFRAVALSGGHHVEIVDRSSPAVVADEERALQIGRILVENALIHTPSGTIVRLSTARRDGTALLTVEDDGPGIPPKDVPQVFDRFYRVEGSAASGSGLGLAIARELAGLMGGTVELHVTPGRTIFALVLPVARRDSDDVAGADAFHVESVRT